MINKQPTDKNRATPDMEILKDLERKALWLSAWMVHHANHIRPNEDGMKVGGHQASSASMVSIMTALYFAILRPEDRIAVKPHASPVFHAIQYLFGNQRQEQLENFRGFGGAQSYPSRTKDQDDVDFSTGSVGLGAAVTAFASLVQDYVRAKGWAADRPEGRMIALVGDAELDEGNIYECLLEGWKHDLRNTWWVIDYNRQSLDGIVHEGLYERIEKTFEAFGWDVITLKHGVLQRAAFDEPGGDILKRWIDDCPNPLYAALTYQAHQDVGVWRERLMAEIGGDADVARLLDARSDEQLRDLMGNLGGHCLPTLIETFQAIDHDQPVCVIAYTIKGWGLPLAGHKDNHAGIMAPDQMAQLQTAMNVRSGHEWDSFEGMATRPAALQAFLDDTPFNRPRLRRLTAKHLPIEPLPAIAGNRLSTQDGFGKIMNEISRSDAPYAERIVTMSPDVSVSTNLGPWINRRKIFSRNEVADTFRDEQIASVQRWEAGPKGQHLELGIAENNLFLLLAAAGLSHSLNGERLLPVGTLYDPFISRGLDALNYASYQDARFMLVATPSGVTLAPEGGAHQSIGTPLIGMAQDGLASFEPAFVDELAAIMEWGFEHMQCDEDGGSVYLRCSTRTLEQPVRQMTDELREHIIEGAYWLREPGPNCELVIAYQGAVAPEAIAAAGLCGEDRRDIGVLAVTSADRLQSAWHQAQQARRHGIADSLSHIEKLLAGIEANAPIITVHDGHPTALAWLGGVYGNRIAALGVEHFGQTGTVAELYDHFEIDTAAILATVNEISDGRPVRYV